MMKHFFSVLFLTVLSASLFSQSLLKDIEPGSKNGLDSKSQIVKLQDKLYFIGDNFDLFETDGTENGTKIFVNRDSAFYPKSLTLGKTKLFSMGSTSLMSYDGKPNGSKKLKTLPSSSDLSRLYQLKDDTFIFGEKKLNAANNISDIWITDGTAVGTTSLGSFGFSPYYMVASNFKNYLVFNEASSSSVKVPTLMTDGTKANTKLVTDFISPFVQFTSIFDIVGMGDYLVIKGIKGGFSRTYICDGTAAGTKEVTNAAGSLTQSLQANGKWFLLTSGSLYVFNTATKDFDELASDVNYFSTSIAHKNQVFYYSTDNFLWASNGTKIGTKKHPQKQKVVLIRLFHGRKEIVYFTTK